MSTCRVGDAVYGVANFPGAQGSYAEYGAVKASQVGHKPAQVSFIEAAVPLAALTAWTDLYAAAHLLPGERILIHGASSGVGSFAVQLAKWTGAYVIATAPAANQAFARELGADEVLDYHQPFEQQLHEAGWWRAGLASIAN